MTDPPLDNPYAPPEAPLEPTVPTSDEPAPTDPEAIRLASLRDERYVRAFGPASFAAGLMVLAALVLNAYRSWGYLEPSVWVQIPYFYKVAWIARAFVVPPLMIWLHFALGFAFRKLEPWARPWQIGLSASVLAAFAVNRILTPGIITDIAAVQIVAFGVVHVVIIYRLTGAKGAMIFSEEYHKVIEATPQIHRWIGPPSLDPALMTVAILGGLVAGWGDDWVAYTIAQHFATRLMGAHLEL